jgi:hypothetical protein
VVFQISQIGSDPDSKTFLDNLANDSRLTNVYVTSSKSYEYGNNFAAIVCSLRVLAQLDKQFRELRQNERDLEAWVIPLYSIYTIGTRLTTVILLLNSFSKLSSLLFSTCAMFEPQVLSEREHQREYHN